VRAYELRPNCLERISVCWTTFERGTLVVHTTRICWDKYQLSPYPALISRRRCNPRRRPPPIAAGLAAPHRRNHRSNFLSRMMRFSPVPTKSRRLTSGCSERGLYFWTQFDSKYTPPRYERSRLAVPDAVLSITAMAKALTIYRAWPSSRQWPEGSPPGVTAFRQLLIAREPGHPVERKKPRV